MRRTASGGNHVTHVSSDIPRTLFFADVSERRGRRQSLFLLLFLLLGKVRKRKGEDNDNQKKIRSGEHVVAAQMPRLILQSDSMGLLLQGPVEVPGSSDSPPGFQRWPGSAPRWALPSKHRNQFDRIAQEKATVTQGWPSFYAAADGNPDAEFRVGDTSRRHLVRPGATEATWKPCFKLVARGDHPLRSYGNKAVEPPQNRRREHEEVGDIPQGKKHISPPLDQLPKEMNMFQLKHKVRVGDGSLANQRMSDPSVADPPRGPKLVPMADRRNGVPVGALGDKPYSAVEVSPEYLGSMGSSKPRLGLDKIAADARPADAWLAKQKVLSRHQDVACVRALPDIGGNDED